LVRFVAVGLLLLLAAMGALTATFGWQGLLTQMGWFFTKATLPTFGGAYAVLPCGYQGAVTEFGYKPTARPLIMVVAFVGFVGFVGGWGRPMFGPDQLFLAGAAAAVVVTFFTFLPSFLFILVDGPLVDATHGDMKFTAPLTAITAAVVGVIPNLACSSPFMCCVRRASTGGSSGSSC